MAEDTTLFMKRTFAVPRNQVFEAWTNPDMIRQWFAAGPDMVPTIAEVDLRVGGKYRIGMKNKAKNVEHIATGIYREIIPNERVAFTWSWEGSQGEPESFVIVELIEQGEATEMRFTHSRFADKKARDGHNEGWIACFAELEKALAG